MKTTVHRVASGLFPSDMPTRGFYVRTEKRKGGYAAWLCCAHFDCLGRIVKVVKVYDAGIWQSRWLAHRQAESRLASYLADYPADNISVSRERIPLDAEGRA